MPRLQGVAPTSNDHRRNPFQRPLRNLRNLARRHPQDHHLLLAVDVAERQWVWIKKYRASPRVRNANVRCHARKLMRPETCGFAGALHQMTSLTNDLDAN